MEHFTVLWDTISGLTTVWNLSPSACLFDYLFAAFRSDIYVSSFISMGFLLLVHCPHRLLLYHSHSFTYLFYYGLHQSAAHHHLHHLYFWTHHWPAHQHFFCISHRKFICSHSFLCRFVLIRSLFLSSLVSVPDRFGPCRCLWAPCSWVLLRLWSSTSLPHPKHPI